MDVTQIMAQVLRNPDAAQTSFMPIESMWRYITELRLVESLTFISFGVVWLVYGWKVFKILTTICFSLLGLFVGVWVHRALIGGDVVWLSVLFMMLFAFGSFWFMKWSVSCLGGVAGAILASGVWLACGFTTHLVWAGAMVGFVGGGMLSFIILKGAVMMFTCLGGSLLTVTGILAIFYHYLDIGPRLEDLVFGHRWFLPFMMTIPMAIGMVIQYRLLKDGEELSV